MFKVVEIEDGVVYELRETDDREFAETLLSHLEINEKNTGGTSKYEIVEFVDGVPVNWVKIKDRVAVAV